MNNAAKDDKLFEALSELDDELIAKAKHIDTYGEQTVVLRRTPVWKIVTGSVAAAACTALLAVGGIHAMNYVNGKAPVESNQTTSALSSNAGVSIEYAPAEYPEEAKYVYNSDYGALTSFAYCTGKHDGAVLLMPEFFGSYEEMAAASELIVSGQFTDLTHQIYDPYDDNVIPVDGSPSYNTFYIDKVVKGDIEPGQGIAIRQNDHVYRDTVYVDWDMSAMVCGDRWIYFLVKGEDGYYTPVTPKQGRYPLPFSENKKMLNVGEYGYYGYDDSSSSDLCDPNIDTIYADTLEAFGLGVSENFDGVELSVVLNDNTFDVDDDIRVKATVRNTTDEPIGLFMPVQGEGSHTEIFTAIVHGGYALTDVDTEDKVFNDAIASHIVQPGEEYVQEMTFRLKEKLEQGKYNGRAFIQLLSDPNDETSETTEHSVAFSLTVGEDDSKPADVTQNDVTKVYEYGGGKTEEWIMPEFPGVSCRCDGEGVSVLLDGDNGADEYGYFLYTGMPIEDVYLADLNGDGKRELVSTAAFGSGIIDSRVYAFDFASGVRYTLCDRGNYDYTLAANNGVLTVLKFKYNDSTFNNEPVSEQPLTLDMMTTDGSVYVFKGFEAAKWTMDELPGITFRADRSGIFAKRKDGSESNIAVDSEYDLITCVYLYDNDGDGKREIIFEYIDKKGMHISRMLSADVLLADYSGENTGGQSEQSVTQVYKYGDEVKNWTMQEYPGFSFRCEGNMVKVFVDGVKDAYQHRYTICDTNRAISDVYLVDINGDGNREIVSYARKKISSYITESRIYAFDPANGVGAALCSRGNYYYTLNADNGTLDLFKYKFDGAEPVSEQPLAFDMLTSEVRKYVFKGIEPAEWTMDEFPGVTFYADEHNVTVKNSDGTVNVIDPNYADKGVSCVYLDHCEGAGNCELNIIYTDLTTTRITGGADNPELWSGVTD